jgi:NAD(P)-dependent dehydrogenase (short-subunit alcohol dehydrogenase family)
MRLEGKVALITGAGVGIGRACAALFAQEGAAVAVVDRNPETCQETVAQITQSGGRALAIVADVARSEDVQRMLQETVAAFGKLNILFNNAGIVAQGTVEQTTEAQWDDQIATTLTSVFLGCKYGIPYLRAQGGGVIINTASVAGVRGLVNRAVYSAAKGGVVAMTRSIALDHAHEQIRAVYLSPATIETPSLLERINTAPDPVAARKAFEARQPIGRIGTTDDVAYAALYLASDEASFLTGCNLAVDGGMTA